MTILQGRSAWWRTRPTRLFDSSRRHSSLDQATARARLDLPERGLILLFFGLVREYKGLETLLRALPHVRQRLPHVRLIVAGEFWRDKQMYLDLISELGLDERVLLHDRYIPNEEVSSSIFAAADVLVAPYKSITGSAVLQVAAAFGLPVIGSNAVRVALQPAGQQAASAAPTTPQQLADDLIAFAEGDATRALAPLANVGAEEAEASWQRLVDAVVGADGKQVMRIVFLLTTSLESPYAGGRCWPFARELARRGHDVHLVALHHDWATFRHTGDQRRAAARGRVGALRRPDARAQAGRPQRVLWPAAPALGGGERRAGAALGGAALARRPLPHRQAPSAKQPGRAARRPPPAPTRAARLRRSGSREQPRQQPFAAARVKLVGNAGAAPGRRRDDARPLSGRAAACAGRGRAADFTPAQRPRRRVVRRRAFCQQPAAASLQHPTHSLRGHAVARQPPGRPAAACLCPG